MSTVPTKHPFLTGYTNLMKSVLGIGIISYPYLFSNLGVLLTLLCMSISATFSGLGLILFLYLNEGRNKTMSTLTHKKYIFWIVNFVIVSKCLSVTISYIITIKDIVEGIMKFAFTDKDTKTSSKVCFIVLTLIISPVSTLKRFSKLRITSFIGVFAVFMMVTLTMIRIAKPLLPFMKNDPTSIPGQATEDLLKGMSEESKHEPQLSFFFPTDDSKTGKDTQSAGKNTLHWSLVTLSLIGSFVYSFTCHQNIFSFSNECKMSFRSSIICIFAVISSCMALYTIFGILNAYKFKISSKLFDSLPNDRITIMMKLFFLFVVVFAIPLQLNAAQSYLNIQNTLYRFIFCISIHLVGIVLALFEFSFIKVIKNIGGTVSSFLCYIIPGMYILYFYKSTEYEMTPRWAWMGGFTLLWGVCVLVYTIVSLILW